ncbi:MAG: DUF4369 domain-containing protein [Bacteroidaceae bacterium]|nr:DUF4369 domain-containing protein [Bacteroidaceae bacterium]
MILRRSTDIIVLCLSLLLAACGQSYNYTLTGSVPGVEYDSIFVTGLDSRYERVDTIRIVGSRFTYKAKVDTVVPLLLFFSSGVQHVVFADKDISAKMVCSRNDSLPTVTGSVYDAQLADFLNTADTLDIFSRVENFIRKDPFSEVTPYLIFKYVLTQPDLDEQKLRGLIGLMAGVMKENAYISELSDQLAMVPGQNRMYLPINSQVYMPDSVRSVPLENVVNSGYYLLVLWATWQPESREALKALDTICARYISNGIKFVAYSMDADREKWEKAVKEDSLTNFIHINSFRGLNTPVLTQFKVRNLPYYFISTRDERVLLETPQMEKADSVLSARYYKPVD